MTTQSAAQPVSEVPKRHAGSDATGLAAGDVWTAFLSTVGIVVSVVLTIGQLLLGNRLSPFVQQNFVEPEVRFALFIAVASSILVSAVTILAWRLWRGRTAFVGLHWFARIAAPAALLWAWPLLFMYEFAKERTLAYLLLLCSVVLGTERLLRVSFAAAPKDWALLAQRVNRRIPGALRRYAPFAAVCSAAAGYSAFMGHFTILNHQRFQTSGYDLGIYTSLLQNFVAGNFFRSPILNPNVSYLAHHAEFGVLYLVPLYALFPRAETLLVLQSVTLGIAAIPLYLFASALIPRASAALIAILYLLFAPLHGPNFYDFHWMPMTLPLWFLLFYALARRRLWLGLVAAALLIPMRDEVGFFMAALGLFLIATAYWPRLGLGLILIGPVWTLFMRLVVTPAHGDAGFEGYYKLLIAPGERGFGAVARTVLSNPSYVWTTLSTEAKLIYALHFLAPLALLPLRRAWFALLLLPGALFTLFTAGYPPPISIAFQYTTHLIPWVFLTAVLSLRCISLAAEGPVLTRRAAVLSIALGVFAHSYVFGAILQHHQFTGGFHHIVFSMTDEERERFAAFSALKSEIPLDATVAATDSQSPHFGEWTNICSLRITHCDAEYLFIDRNHFGSEDRRRVRDALSIAEYGLVDSRDGFYVFRRGHVSKRTAKAMRELGLR